MNTESIKRLIGIFWNQGNGKWRMEWHNNQILIGNEPNADIDPGVPRDGELLVENWKWTSLDPTPK